MRTIKLEYTTIEKILYLYFNKKELFINEIFDNFYEKELFINEIHYLIVKC